MSRIATRAAAIVAAVALAGPGPVVAAGDQVPVAGPEPIYRLRLAITTTASSVRLFLDQPSVLIRAEARRARGEARFVGFGRGPLVLERRPAAPLGRAVFIAAVTPGGSGDLRFRSVKRGPGDVSLRVANRNGVEARPILFVHHDRPVRRFSVPVTKVAAGGPVEGTEPLPPVVYAFYYPWYELEDWAGGKPIGPGNVNPRPYASDDSATIDRHIAEARGAGIDGFLVSWWGRDVAWERNVRILAERIPPGFSFALYLEIFSPLFRTEEDLIRQVDYALDTYASSDRYVRIGGRPVLYAFSTHNVMQELGAGHHPRYEEVWSRVMTGLAAEGHDPILIGEGRPFEVEDFDVFDGMHVYGTEDPGLDPALEWEMALTARAWAAVHGGDRRIWGASVLPGYDDRHIPGRVPAHFPREDGRLYEAQWNAGIDSSSDQVLVVSFNEWLETTNIEPNVEWGDRYLDLTAELAARFRSSR